jgi:Ni/Fe-hydrogenase subunit HybB-like protein
MKKNASTILVYIILAAVVAVGLGVGIVRLINGMGPTTALTDSYPWGLWILYDVFFVPFSAGAFMILAVAHIYNRHEYHTIARPVILAGFLGELMVVAVLLMDLGRWNQFYNVLLPWNWNFRSFMFQVSLCLTIYLGVMILEMAPAVLERLNLQKPLRVIRSVTVLIAGLGIVLSSLHQSSLGSLFLLMPYKLSPLWWTPLLPILFLVSSAFSGLAMAIFVALATFRIFRRPLKLQLLSNLARVAAVIMGLYLILKVGDLFFRGEFNALWTSGRLSVLFIAEVLIGVVVPLVLFGRARFRENSGGLFWGSVSVLFGVLLNRANVALLAENVTTGASYVPYWMEIAISIAAIAAGILLFGLAVCCLPILPGSSQREDRARPLGLSRWVALPVGAVLVLLTPLVTIGLQPVIHSETIRPGTAAMAMFQPIPVSENCSNCHTSQDALLAAGARQEDLGQLLVKPEDPETPHGAIECVTCHHGNDSTQDLETVHSEVIADPSQGDAHMCLSCHHDLPEDIPQDRLRTPHNEVAHGQAADVYCSDCHGGVGHGFDPMTGNVICPMTVCLDCHTSRQLDSELTDCNACHMTPHDPAPAAPCNECHQSTEAWQSVVAADTHPLALTGTHAEAQCLDCHQKQQLAADCSACHEPPQGHATGTCSDCHTPVGWLASVASLAPPLGHELASLEDCALCHAPDSKIKPAPGSHTDLANEQCLTCHKAPTVTHDLGGRSHCMVCHDPAGQVVPAPAGHAEYSEEQCLPCHQAEQ